jgi:predicted nucleic acid-binding protein
MIVVSDATPLRHLIAIGRADLLPELFGKVIVPTAVLGELQHDSTPAVVRTWVEGLPGWVEVRSPSDLRLPSDLPGHSPNCRLAGSMCLAD